MTDININPKDTEIDVTIQKVGGGTSDYNELNNKPSINGIELTGNKTTADLGIEIPTVPTKTSELENDSGFIPQSLLEPALQVVAEHIQKNATDIQDLNNKVDNLPTGEAGSSIGYIGDYDSTYTYKAGDIVRRYVDDANGYMFFMSVSDNNKGNRPDVISLFDPKWFCITRTYPYVYGSKSEVPIATINSGGTTGGTPSGWTLHVPNTATRLNQMPKIDLYTGILKAPSGIEGYYTSTEIDDKLGNIDSLLDTINGEVI